MEFVIAVATEIGKCLVGQSIGHVRYLLHLESNFEDLKIQKDELSSKQKQVQDNVEEAERNAEEIKKDVQQWLTNVSKVMEDVRKLEEKIQLNRTCFNGWCPNWSWRYRLSKEATKKKDKMVKLQEKSFDRVSCLATLPEIISSKDFMPFETTTSAFDQIMEELRDEKNYVIGLHGIGGVGKTTLAKEVGKKAKKEGLVNVVAIAVVSQTPDSRKIQDDIATFLGLKFYGAGDFERVTLLSSRLKNEKKILIILDDVWKTFDLAAIGLPYGDDHKGCKVLLTTRRQHVCNSMGSKNIQLGALSKMEAWALFQKSAALDDNSPTLNLAMEVAGECKGLPLAITAVGSALKGKSLDEYKRAFIQLKNARLVEIEDVDHDDKNVYASLQLSYDYLKSEEDKFCFLMCSLFPEDYKINLEDLVRYGMGLDLFKDINSIEEARSQLRAIINNLKDSSLLLEASNQQSVKMHDVVRDVALWIASKGENVFMVRAGVGLTEWPKKDSFEQFTAISLMANKIKILPSKLRCPRLEILLLGGEDSLIIPDTFFEGMKALKVLTLSKGSLDLQSLEFLTNLRTLQLGYCKFKDNSSLGKLKRLEVLNFSESHLEELPNEVGELSNLRLLDLTGCEQLKRIPPGVIRRLSLLKELYIGCYSFEGWEIERDSGERINASISELNYLSYLVVLSMHLTPQCLPQDFSFHSRLLRYDIQLAKSAELSKDDYPHSRKLVFHSIDASSEINAFKELFQNVEILKLKGTYGCQNIIPNMEKGGFIALISLGLKFCNEMKCLIDSSQQQVPTTAFSNLEELSLKQMTHLREICNGNRPPMGFLQKLKTLNVIKCSNMPSVFPRKLLQRSQNLEEVTVESCDELQEVFGLEGPTHHVVEGTHVMLLSKLTSLHLNALPKLSCVWKGPTQHVSLQSLRDVEVSFCNRLAYVFTSSLARSLVQLQRLEIANCEGLEHIINIEKEDGEILTEAHVQPLYFSKLTTLEIINCEKLEYIFPISIARGLRQLEKLQISDCPQLKQVFSHGKEDDVFVGDGNDIMLPELRAIELKGLSSLTSFSEGNYHWTWPSLQELTVVECPKLTTSFLTALEASSKLQRLKMDKCEELEQIIFIEKGDGKISSEAHVQPPYFSKLTTLEITNCNRVTYLFLLSVARSLVELQRLKIDKCEGLEQFIIIEKEDREILTEAHLQPFCFSKLTTLKITNCKKLEYIFPLYIAGDLRQLEKLEIFDCPQVKQVFNHGKEEDVFVGYGNDIMLPKLSQIELRGLSSLTSFSEGNYHWMWPSLQELAVGKCPKLTTSFITDLEASLKLQRLKMDECEELEQIIFIEKGDGKISSEDHVQPPYFSKLTTLEITNCNRVTYLFLLSIARSLVELQRLKIEKCEGLEQFIIIEKEDREILTETHLQLFCFSKLTTLQITNCKKLEYIFPLYIAGDLQQLEELQILDCPQLKQVFNHGKEEDVFVGDGNDIMLPKLRKIELKRLSSLISFSEGNYHWMWPSLQELTVMECPKLTTSFITDLEASLKLQRLKMDKCEELEHIIFIEKGDGKISSKAHVQPPYFSKLTTLEITNCNRVTYLFLLSLARSLVELQRLKIDKCEGLEQIIIIEKEDKEILTEAHGQPLCFSKLTTLEITNCKKLEYIFPLYIAGDLRQLEQLQILDCPQLKQVFNHGKEEDVFVGDGNDIMLPKLRKIELKRLSSLISFSEGNYHCMWPSLQELTVVECPKLTTSFITDLEASLKLQRLKMDKCEELEHIIFIEKGDGKISSKAHVQPPYFSKLTTLEITNCKKLEYIFPFYVAGDLQQLEKLQILDCPQVKQVFNHGKEEDVFVGDGNDIMLPKLRKIELKRLSSLISFSEGNYHCMWPSLQELTVVECPKLTTSFITDLEASLKQLRILWIGNYSLLQTAVFLILRQGLQYLEELTIENCEGVQELFHGISTNTDDELSASNLKWLCACVSNLKKLGLKDLPEPRVLWKGPTQISNFQNLSDIRVNNCNKLTHIFSPSLARNLPRLECLYIEGCEELKGIIDEEDKDEEDQIIPFPNLKRIDVIDCNKLKSLFPITIAQGLPQLEYLWVKKASQLEEVFSHENEEDVRDEKKIVLPRLYWLRLRELPRLISICQGDYHFIFPSLDVLEVNGCFKITTSFTIASDGKTVHAKDKAKAETPQSVTEDLQEGFSTNQGTVATTPSDSNIFWWRSRHFTYLTTLPPYIEELSTNL